MCHHATDGQKSKEQGVRKIKTLTKKEMKRQMEALEVLSLEAKKEIANFLKVESNILNDVNIRVSNYRVDINVCNYDVFILSKCWGDDIKYSTSIYSTRKSV